MQQRDQSFIFEQGRLRLEGFSAAGVETWLRVDPPGIGLDVGRGPRRLVPVRHLFVSHPHTDHAAGIVYLAAQRKLNGLEPPRVTVPAELVDRYEQLFESYGAIYGSRPRINLVGAAPGDEFPLPKGYTVRAWNATHNVPARSWELLESRNILRPEFSAKNPDAIREAVASGESVSERRHISALFYSGDTDERIFDSVPAIAEAEIVILECTFTAPEDLSRAEDYGHVHLDRLAELAPRLKCSLLVLTHFSLRDDVGAIVERVRRSLPPSILARTRLAIGDEVINP